MPTDQQGSEGRFVDLFGRRTTPADETGADTASDDEPHPGAASGTSAEGGDAPPTTTDPQSTEADPSPPGSTPGAASTTAAPASPGAGAGAEAPVAGTTEPAAGAGTISVRLAKPATDEPAPSAPKPGSHRRRELRLTRAVVAAAAVAGLFVEVTPSGTWWADRLMAAGFVALVAGAGSCAKRWTWFVAAGAALTLSEGRVALVCGLVALIITLISTGPVRPVPAVGAAAGALSALALLRVTDLGFHGASALVAAVAVAPLLVSGYRYAGRTTRRRTRRTVVATAAVLALVGAAYALAAAQARPAAERGVDLMEQGMDAAREGDDVRATDLLAEAADAFADADRHLGSWYAAPAQVVPIVGHNAIAAETMASAAAEVSRDGTDVAYDADLESLTVQQGTLDLARVRALSEPLGDVATVLAAADADLADVDDAWLLGTLADQLDRVRGEITDARPDVDLAADATRVIPAIFGGDGESRWLVAFVTPVEARGRTGFMGNFAELTATDGSVDMSRFGRAPELESGGTPGDQRTISGPDDYLASWARFSPAEVWRNVTMSPEFPSVGQVMTELYPQSGGQPVDGVIAIDPVGLAALMNFTGPIDVPELGRPVTAETAADFLLREQYLAFADNEDRIDSLETLARTTFDRLTTGDLPSPGTVADVLGPVVDAGHIHAYGADPDQQALFEDIGIDGALPEVTGDSLAVVSNNAVGNKIDLFLDRDISYDVAWDPATGELAATATVTLTNNAPSQGLPGYVIGSPLAQGRRPPPGTNRTYLSIYSPWELDAAQRDGEPVLFDRQIESDRNAYSLFLDIPPEGGTTTVTLSLVGALAPGADYSLDVSTQPLVEPDQLSLTVDVAGDRAIAATAPLAVDGRTVTATEALVAEATDYRIEIDP